MPTQTDVARIAGALPGAEATADGLGFRVGGKLFVWTYLERVHPKRRRIPNHEAIGVSVPGDDVKQDLLAADPGVFFTTDHYDGYDAVLVRLPKVGFDTLEELIRQAWACRAPKRLLRDSA